MSFNPSPLAVPERLNDQVQGRQDYISTTQLANGDMIVVWQSPHAEFDGEFSPPLRVMLQRLDASGTAVGPEVQIHQNPDFAPKNNASYLYPEVAALKGGGYAVVFVDNPIYSPANPQLRVKTFDASGSQTADTLIPNPQYQVASNSWATAFYNSSGEIVPIALEGGGLAVVWSASYTGMLAQYAGQTTNYVQRLGADGALEGEAVTLTPWVASVSYSQDFHDWVNDAAPLPGGGFVVLYRGGMTTGGNDTGKPVIMAQTFGVDGQPNATPVVIKEPTVANNLSQSDAQIAALEGGGFVAIWSAANVGIEGQRFDAGFNPGGPAFAAMPTDVGGGQSTVSATPDGGFIVTTLQSIYSVKAQRFDADGVSVGEPSVVASRALFPGVSYFGGSYDNAPGWWEFSPDGTGQFFIVGNSISTDADIWTQPFRSELFGTSSSDTLTGMTGNDIIHASLGNDTIDGGFGTDIVVYQQPHTAYSLETGGNGWTVNGPEGLDTLINIERLQFADKKLALDLGSTQNGGQSVKFIGALAYPLAQDAGVFGQILSYFDQGYSLSSICNLAVNVGLTASLAGSGSNAALAKLVFRNLVGGEADAATTDLLVGFMDGRHASYTQGEFLAAVADLDLNQEHIGLVGLQLTGLEYA